MHLEAARGVTSSFEDPVVSWILVANPIFRQCCPIVSIGQHMLAVILGGYANSRAPRLYSVGEAGLVLH